MQVNILEKENLQWNKGTLGLKVTEERDCDSCHTVAGAEDLRKNFMVCPHCGYHFRITAKDRIAITLDEDTFEEVGSDIGSVNPIKMIGYEDKLEQSRRKTELKDGVITGTGKLADNDVAIAVMSFEFMGGSMGSVIGEKITRLLLLAADKGIPAIIFTASGGARMQEGIFSLMQMAKTANAIALLEGLHVPLINVLMNPTMGGVTASFAMLGDITLAESGAMIGFAGRRVIEGTIKEELPVGFQTAEFLQDKGFVDKVVDRRVLRSTLRFLLETHKNNIF
ncbi:acetyl-CoA carboxylase, carboxyltransferase subunit beta [Candidatus Haliotispira prima]|uniref:Acetyl-coenzyme A carboxylase carboxyl transferase subunit beta n=1 Tax=Candidatus Haliotispira prima TaxID=3034016 RepID=A0ABY8MH26_9SPIO|nr:acetyl-CoA carboxylase, carboxyltransferase subunit beta [Candidatus Haliotispira prima]